MKNWQIFLFGLILFEIIADIFTKYFSISNKLYLAILAISCYVIANTSWIISMKYHSNLTLGANIFSISTGIIATIIGAGFFGETINTNQWIGIFLGIIALFFIFW